MHTPPKATPDMGREEFDRAAEAVVDWIASYLDDPRTHPVLSRVAPGEVADRLPAHAPDQGEPFSSILEDFQSIVLPGVTHWNHPRFFAYFGITGSPVGVLAEALIATLNVNAMLWRTSPAATELEEVATGWLRDLVGLPHIFRGHIQDTASISTLVAIATAREQAGFSIRDEGMAGRGLPALRMYCSEEAHSSVEKAAITIGIGRSNTVRIPTDDAYRMRPGLLSAAIEEDLAAGHHPFCIVATTGTTSTTSVDPVGEIAEIAERHGLWLHVDAAYGGAAAILPEKRGLLAGWERADSIVINPHKWLFTPIDCSTLFLRDPDLTRAAFTLVPEYLRTTEAGEVSNLMDFGPALGRRFRSLKLWAVLRYFGRAGLQQRLREHIRLAGLFAEWVEEEAGWRVEAPVPFSAICFRYAPHGIAPAEADAMNERILQHVNASGEAFLSHTRLRGRYALRLAIGNLRTTEADVRVAWELLRQAADRAEESD